MRWICVGRVGKSLCHRTDQPPAQRAGGIAGQEDGQGGSAFERGTTATGDALSQRIELRIPSRIRTVAEFLPHLRMNRAGSQGIDLNMCPFQLQCQRFREPHDRDLTHAIGR